MHLELNARDAEKIIRHPDVYPAVSDDGSVSRETYTLHEGVTALVVYDPKPIACSIFYPNNSVTWEIHTQTLPEGRSRSYSYGKAMLSWIWDNMPIQKLVANIPQDNRQALLYTLRLGFEIEGINKQSFMRNGVLMDQTHIGLRR